MTEELTGRLCSNRVEEDEAEKCHSSTQLTILAAAQIIGPVLEG